MDFSTQITLSFNIAPAGVIALATIAVACIIAFILTRKKVIRHEYTNDSNASTLGE